MYNNTDLEEALSYDALAHAEKITGQSYKEDDKVTFLGLGLAQAHREKMDALLFLNRDTNSWNQTAAEWISIVEEMGFKKVLDDSFAGSREREEKFFIWWHPDGILLTAETFCGERINTGKAYFCYYGDYDALTKCSHSPALHPSYPSDESSNTFLRAVDYDAREGLRHFLNKCRASGKFIPKWPARPFLWLLNYMESKVPGCSYEAINRSRLERLPNFVREAITPEPNPKHTT